MTSNVDRLQRWYASQCDGDWEHTYGVRIETLDNPGWLVTIDLADTDLEPIAFETRKRGRSDEDSDWVLCQRQGAKFVGAGGIGNLDELVGAFVEWAEGHTSRHA